MISIRKVYRGYESFKSSIVSFKNLANYLNRIGMLPFFNLKNVRDLQKT